MKKIVSYRQKIIELARIYKIEKVLDKKVKSEFLSDRLMVISSEEKVSI